MAGLLTEPHQRLYAVAGLLTEPHQARSEDRTERQIAVVENWCGLGVIDDNQQGKLAYWKANVRLIMFLLGIWAFVSYGLGIIFAGPLNNILLGQLPLGFWFAQQGSMFVFVILIFVYSKLMDNVDKEYDVQE